MVSEMGRPPTQITVSEDERRQLEAMIKRPKAEARYVERARMVLWAAEGQSNLEIARRLDTREARVSRWRTRFEREGLAGLHDAPRMGRPPHQSEVSLRSRILAQLDQAPPAGFARWNGPLLASALGDVTADQVWAQLRALGISLERRRSWCVSTDPQFAAKAADIVGLYLAPPCNAVVLSIDEKPCIQALERAQGWLRLPNGRAVTGFAHEYKRHGTSTLFAALETATGRVFGGHYRRKRRDEFLDFLNTLLAAYPGQTLHLILDNLSTHVLAPEHPWRRRNPQVHFHFTPTHASWLNQIEVWFSILSNQALRGASFTSVAQLTAAIDAFISSYNTRAAPFNWTKVRVSQKNPSSKYANLVN
jgi:transposase